MKLDKETVIKQRFWFLLGLLIPLVLLGFVIVWTSAAGEIEEKEIAFQKSVKSIEAVAKGQPKNPSWVEILKERENEASKKKGEIWVQAWGAQEPIFTSWPKVRFTEPLEKKKFGDPIADDDCITWASKSYYKEQLQEIAATAGLTNSKGEVLVQFKDGWEKVLRYIETFKDNQPPSEELWLAQEDLWVQRALLDIVSVANKSVANYQIINGGKVPAKDDTSRTFRNPNWQLETKVIRNPQGKWILQYRLVNVSPRLQPLGVPLNLVFKETNLDMDLFIEGEPLLPSAATTLAEKEVPGVAKPGPVDSVIQVFDWRAAPVKRVDKIALGQHSHRTFSAGLKESPAFSQKKAEAPTPKATGGGAGPAGANPGSGSPVSLGSGDGGGAASSKTPNGIEKKRYVEINDQVRRMPFGLVVIVDQAHIQDVLTAVTNSKMRIQITQVEWQHYRNKDIKPASASIPSPTPKKPKPATGASPLPGVTPAGGPAPSGGGTKSGPAAPSDDPASLVELSVYGIANLYERYTPPAAQPAPGGQPGGQPTQAGGGPIPAAPAPK